MKYLENILLLIASIILYTISPYGVNMVYIYLALAIFLLGSYGVIKLEFKKKNYLSFNLIFFTSFFCVTYLFPIAILNTDLDVRYNQMKYVDFNYLTKAVALSTIAICAYFLGYIYSKDRAWDGKKDAGGINRNNSIIARRVNLVLAFAVLLNAIIFIQLNKNTINVTEAPFLNQIYEVSLVFALLAGRHDGRKSGVLDFFYRNKIVLIFAGIVMLFFLYVGDRGLPIQIAISILAVYSFYYSKIRLSNLLIIGFTGVVVMFALRVTRTTSDSISRSGIGAAANATQQSLEGTSALVMLSDLYGASQELCFGYEYTQKEGLTDPAQIIILPFTPLPKVPSILSDFIFDKTPAEMSSGYIMNIYMSRYSDSAFGSHCVIDIYMKWGSIGILLLFSIFGYVIALIEKGSGRNTFCTVMSVIIVAYAIYLPRDSILDIIRPMFYVVVLMWVYNSYRVKKRIIRVS